MDYIPIKEYNLKILRTLALQKPLVDRKNFYLPVKEKIKEELSKMQMMDLSKMIFSETEPCLQELECFALEEQLANYIGPITIEYLNALMEIFPISSIWHLAVNAKFLVIQEKAKEKLSEILDQYGHEMKEEDKTEKRKKYERNKK